MLNESDSNDTTFYVFYIFTTTEQQGCFIYSNNCEEKKHNYMYIKMNLPLMIIILHDEAFSTKYIFDLKNLARINSDHVF